MRCRGRDASRQSMPGAEIALTMNQPMIGDDAAADPRDTEVERLRAQLMRGREVRRDDAAQRRRADRTGQQGTGYACETALRDRQL